MLRYDPPDVLIEPNLLEFGSLEFNRGKEALEEGRIACEKVKEELIQKVKNWI
jgi:predicted acylesterase/phospholipase RssA